MGLLSDVVGLNSNWGYGFLKNRKSNKPSSQRLLPQDSDAELKLSEDDEGAEEEEEAEINFELDESECKSGLIFLVAVQF